MAKTNILGNRTSALTINDAYSLPTADGTANYVMMTDGAGAVTWQPIADASLTYEEVTASTKQMAVNYVYGVNYAGVCSLTLPASATKGDVIIIISIQDTWEILQNAGQQILFGTESTSAGASYKLSCDDIGSTIRLRCIDTDTTWRATCGLGNFTDSAV